VPDEAILAQLAQPLEPPPTKPSAQFCKTIAFRVTDEQWVAADALRQTFPRGTFSEAFQWLLSSSEGRALIVRRVRGEI
jgi:hypothetical protein